MFYSDAQPAYGGAEGKLQVALILHTRDAKMKRQEASKENGDYEKYIATPSHDGAHQLDCLTFP